MLNAMVIVPSMRFLPEAQKVYKFSFVLSLQEAAKKKSITLSEN